MHSFQPERAAMVHFVNPKTDKTPGESSE